jgi:hypothetical protein
LVAGQDFAAYLFNGSLLEEREEADLVGHPVLVVAIGVEDLGSFRW